MTKEQQQVNKNMITEVKGDIQYDVRIDLVRDEPLVIMTRSTARLLLESFRDNARSTHIADITARLSKRISLCVSIEEVNRVCTDHLLEQSLLADDGLEHFKLPE